jgi:hypothetical protein
MEPTALNGRSTEPPSVRLVRTAPIVGALLGALILGSAMVVFVGSRGYGYDYLAYDAAARRVVADEALYLPDTVERYARGDYEGLYLYPPPVAIAMSPLTVVDADAATFAWMLIRVALLAVACWLLPVRGWVRWAVFAVACITYPVLFDLNLGNVSIVVFGLTALAWRMADRPVASIAHAALIALRLPFALYALQWLVERRIRTLTWTVVAGLAVIAISVSIVGLDTYNEYVAILRGLPDLSTGAHNLSLRTVASESGLPGGIAAIVEPVGWLAGAAAVVFAAARRDHHTAFVVSALATLMVTPFIHPHYLVLLLLPAALLAERGAPWALVLPLLGWLPDPVLPLVGPLAIVLVLLVQPRTGTAGSPVDAPRAAAVGP